MSQILGVHTVFKLSRYLSSTLAVPYSHAAVSWWQFYGIFATNIPKVFKNKEIIFCEILCNLWSAKKEKHITELMPTSRKSLTTNRFPQKGDRTGGS